METTILDEFDELCTLADELLGPDATPREIVTVAKVLEILARDEEYTREINRNF